MDRIQALQKLLGRQEVEVLIVEAPIDLYYLTGMDVSTGLLLVSSTKCFFLLDGRYYEVGQFLSPVPVVLAEPGALEKLVEEEFEDVQSFGLSASKTTLKRMKELQEKLKGCVPVENFVETLRLIKDEGEIKKLQAAAELGSEGYDYVLSILKEGISEKEVAKKLEIFWLEKGADKLAFDPIIAFGESTSMPHYHPTEKTLKNGQPVLIDIGVMLDHYHSDMTRVVFFGGDPDPKLKEIYDIVKEAQQKALDLCKPGIKIGMLDAAARDYITEKGYGEEFMHSLGHGVGLEIHEAPVLRNREPDKNQTLEEGMVITIEPGVYVAGLGGVRIEDTVVITHDGYQDLTKRSK